MKTATLIALSLILTGCTAIPSLPSLSPPTAGPSATPVVIIQTVLVSVIPTWPPTSELPTRTTAPTQTPQIIVVTATPEPGALTQTAAATMTTAPATATLPPNAGGDLFTNLTRSIDHFALRCQPDTITFSVSTGNAYVVGVDFYYRIEDQLSVSISDWQYAGPMNSDKHGTFTLAFPSSRVDPDLRSHRAWFDYQFVGTNKYGDAVGRSAKISRQITYTIDCSD
jgi:hypothetical protein